MEQQKHELSWEEVSFPICFGKNHHEFGSKAGDVFVVINLLPQEVEADRAEGETWRVAKSIQRTT